MSLREWIFLALNVDGLFERSQSAAEEHLCYHHTLLRPSIECFIC